MSTSEVAIARCLRSGPIGLLTCSACTAFDHELPECTTNAQCTAKLSAGGSTVQGVCVHQPTAKCVQLASEDCMTITPAPRPGESVDDGAVLIASLGATTGAQAATNLARQQSAVMAVEEINASNASSGILQSTTPGDSRKLVMLSCDANANLVRAATHLISELHVPAIVGPNLSRKNPTHQAFTAGQSKQLRTNILFGSAIGVGAATAVVAIWWTRWSGGETPGVGLVPSSDGAFVTYGGRF